MFAVFHCVLAERVSPVHCLLLFIFSYRQGPLENLRAELKRTQEAYESLAVKFGEDPKKTTSEQLFTTLKVGLLAQSRGDSTSIDTTTPNRLFLSEHEKTHSPPTSQEIETISNVNIYHCVCTPSIVCMF